MPFKISLSVVDVPVFSSIKDYFTLAKELNINGIELVLGYKTYFSFDTLKRLSREYQLPILSVHQPVAFILKNKWDERAFQVAQYFQAKYVAHPLRDIPLNHDKARSFFSWLKTMHNKYKIQILIENMPKIFSIFLIRFKIDESTSNLLKLSKVCEEYGFGFTLDTTHLAKKEPTETYGYEDIQPYMKNIHLSDFNGVKMHLPLGVGELNLKSFIKHLQRKKYKELLTLEVFGEIDFNWINGKKQIFQNIRDSVNLIRKYSKDN